MMHVKRAFRMLNRFWTILDVVRECAMGIEVCCLLYAMGVEWLRMRHDAFAGASGHQMWQPLLTVCCECRLMGTSQFRMP